MKKVMMGILVVIPIIILLIVAAVSRIVSVQAWIAVEDMTVSLKSGGENLTLDFSEIEGVQNFYDYASVQVLPERANKYTIEWEIANDIVCTDSEYEERYNNYIENKYLNEDDDPDNDIPIEHPAAMMVDDEGNEVVSNSSGKFMINSYCSFTVNVRAEQVARSFTVSVVGYDVESVKLNSLEENVPMKVGESRLLHANYEPIDSIVDNATWASSDENVCSVDENGVLSAKGQGNAQITLSTVRKDGVKVTSTPYEVTVKAAASKFGDAISTSQSEISLDMLGVRAEDITGMNGVRVESGKLIVEGAVASLVLADGQTLTISKCDENAVSIEHAEHFGAESGYVLAVGDFPLKLEAAWTDMLKAGSPSVRWTSSDETVATVENGVVSGVASGRATITASAGDQSASVELNIQHKVTSMRLKTSNNSLAVGLALETVLASSRFSDVAEKTTEPNSLNIVIQGEPQKENMSDDQYREALDIFYDSYTFEIVNGGEFASIEAPNVLVFKPEALDKKGRQTVSVRVSAKYPKYAGVTKYTRETVNVNVIYGVAVNTLDEFEAATQKQKDYAYDAENVHGNSVRFEAFDEENGVTYRVQDHGYSDYTYAISLESNFTYPKGYYPSDTTYQHIYGDLYGNNHMIVGNGMIGYQPDSKDYTGYFGMINVAWSGVTISNVILRATEMTDDNLSSGENVASLKGACISVYGDDGPEDPEGKVTKGRENTHLKDVNVEYSIMENGRWAIYNQNADINISGTVMRNMSSCSIYTPTRIVEDTDDDSIAYMLYADITAHNAVCSNSLATFMSNVYERVTVCPDGGAPRFSDNSERNQEFFKKNFVENGFASSFTQTGFLDIYNWQRAADGRLIDVGNDTYNSLIGAVAGPLVETNPSFAQGRVWYDDEWYFHLGFVISGISLGEGILNEPIYLKTSFEDDRFYSLYAGDIDTAGHTSGTENLIRGLGLYFYGYKNTSNIQPGQTYEINLNFINHLHSYKADI